MEPNSKECILLFSGGRDSTIAAVRLSSIVERLTLVTITSEHLVGIDAVRRRLAELKSYLPWSTKWLHVKQPEVLPANQLFRAPTCLPCHCYYTAVGITLAERLNADSLAFGYTGYQSDWPEQAPYAIERLAYVLSSRGIHLMLPVYDISKKSDVITELTNYCLSIDALEQKCMRQQLNVVLESSHLKGEIAVWEKVLLEIIEVPGGLQIETIAESCLSNLKDLG
jgi:hypothetical protein